LAQLFQLVFTTFTWYAVRIHLRALQNLSLMLFRPRQCLVLPNALLFILSGFHSCPYLAVVDPR